MVTLAQNTKTEPEAQETYGAIACQQDKLSNNFTIVLSWERLVELEQCIRSIIVSLSKTQ